MADAKKCYDTKLFIVILRKDLQSQHFSKTCIFFFLVEKNTIQNQVFNFLTKICKIRNKRWNANSFV